MDQMTDLLVEDFRLAKKSLHRIFAMGIIFALAAQVYVVEPYVSLKCREAALTHDHQAIKTAIKDTLAAEAGIRKAKTGVSNNLKTIRNRVRDFPGHLRRTLDTLQESLGVRQNMAVLSVMQSAPAPGPAIIIPDHIKTVSDAVHWYIDRWFEKLLEDLTRTVATPLKKLADETGIAGTEQLVAVSQQAVAALKAYCQGIDPEFWRSYSGPGGKIDVAGQLQQELDIAFAPVEKKADEIAGKISKVRTRQSEQLLTMQDELKQVAAQISQLTDRLKPLESTFGPIPLELKDLILLFPFILTGLAAFISVRLGQVLTMRAIIKDIVFKDAPELSVAVQSYHLGGWLLPGPGNIPNPVLICLAGFLALTALFLRTAWLCGRPSTVFFQDGYGLLSGSNYRLGLGICLALIVVSTVKAAKDLICQTRET